MLCHVLALPCQKPSWFKTPVMRRIAISTPNVMGALRRLSRDQARPYNFAISPVLVNLSGEFITLLGPFESDPKRWGEMEFVNIHDGRTHRLNDGSLLALPQTFEMVFAQYLRHPEFKSMTPDGSPCKAESRGLLQRYPIIATGLHLIGKETERGWEQSEDISTLLPSLPHYQRATFVNRGVQEQLYKVALNTLQLRTGLSRHSLLRARRGQVIHPRTKVLLINALSSHYVFVRLPIPPLWPSFTFYLDML